MTDKIYTDSELQTNTQLILCIEECDNRSTFCPIDSRLFIGWSYETGKFFVRGRRDDTRTSSYVPYAFQCVLKTELYDFIKFVLGKSNSNIILYNFNNITQTNVDEITYEFFENNINQNYEIAGYNDYKPKRSEFLKYLSLLQTLNNNNNNNDNICEISGW